MNIAKSIIKGISTGVKAIGTEVTIVRLSKGVYDEQTGTFCNIDTHVNVKGITGNAIRNKSDNLIESQSKDLTISAGDITFVPTTRDRVIINNINYRIINVITNEQNNKPISFDLILR
tara:strand:- start:1342 stop:1695 length:354 start_codon:yes stop_codon:yes gene_type:complete